MARPRAWRKSWTRWLRGEPILARPVGSGERMWRWCRRNPAVAGLSAACLMVLIGGLSGVFYQWYQTQQAWQAEKTARGEADEKGQLAIKRAEELTRQRQHLREELHQSDLLRSDLLLQGKDFSQAESLLWKTYLTRPDEKDRRAWWRLWSLYRERPRRGAWLHNGHMNGRTVDFSPGGRHVAVAREGVVSVYDSLTGHEEGTLQISPATAGDMAFAPGDSRLAIAHVWEE